jgi:hypothetical protein
LSADEYTWLTKIHHTGNIANFLPLMTAARIKVEEGKADEPSYCSLLRALECYAYRVFLFEGKRSNAGKSSFHRWADDIFSGRHKLSEVTSWIYGLIEEYTPEAGFEEWVSKPENWYAHRGLLRYTLFEYELHLLATDGQGKGPALSWNDLMSDSTIEHILPQNPGAASDWSSKWTEDEMKLHIHDLGNLVLTQNNSNYLNFDFQRKRGVAGKSPSYIHSDIRQERDVAGYEDWTAKESVHRRDKIVEWAKSRWKSRTPVATALPTDQDDEDAADDIS